MTTPFDGSADPVQQALEELLGVLEANARDDAVLGERVRALVAARTAGRAWHDALAAEEEPGTLQLVSTTLARLSGASGVLRKSLVVELRAQGVSIPTIARLFGVTHQRVSNLLRQTGG